MPTTTTLTIEWESGASDTTATNVTGLTFDGDNVSFHGTINGVEGDYSYPLSNVKRIRKHTA